MSTNSSFDEKLKVKDDPQKDAADPSKYGTFYNSLPDDDRNKSFPFDPYGLLLQNSPSFLKRVLHKILNFNLLQISIGVIFYILYTPPCRSNIVGPCSNFLWWTYLYGLTVLVTLTINALWVASFNFNFKSAYKIVLKPKFEIMQFVWTVAYIYISYYALLTLNNFSSLDKYRSSESFAFLGLLIIMLFSCSIMVTYFINNIIRLVFRFVKVKN